MWIWWTKQVKSSYYEKNGDGAGLVIGDCNIKKGWLKNRSQPFFISIRFLVF